MPGKTLRGVPFLTLPLFLSACVGNVGPAPSGDDDGGSGVDTGPPIVLMDSGTPGDGDVPRDSGTGGDSRPGADTSPPPDTGMACPGGQTRCGGRCVDTASDVSNCGMCGRGCATGATCTGGTCAGGTGCAPAPAGSSAEAQAALETANAARLAMGVPCAEMITEINLAAKNHCDYYAASTGGCRAASAHREVEGCPGFTGVQFWTRMGAAGYSGSAAFEDMAFVNDGVRSTQMWIDSVWHRTPVLSPWVRHIGYGGAAGCDTMDFGRGPSTPADVTAVWPYANQTGVPTSFSGNERPQPPGPFPSGYPITIYVRGTLDTHTLTVDGETTNIPHHWLTPADSDLLTNEYFMYSEEPMQSGTTYRVHVSGGSVDLEWTFTTR